MTCPLPSTLCVMHICIYVFTCVSAELSALRLESEHWRRRHQEWEDVRPVWAHPQAAAEVLHRVDAAAVSQAARRPTSRPSFPSHSDSASRLCAKGSPSGSGCPSPPARGCRCSTSTWSSFLKGHTREWVAASVCWSPLFMKKPSLICKPRLLWQNEYVCSLFLDGPNNVQETLVTGNQLALFWDVGGKRISRRSSLFFVFFSFFRWYKDKCHKPSACFCRRPSSDPAMHLLLWVQAVCLGETPEECGESPSQQAAGEGSSSFANCITCCFCLFFARNKPTAPTRTPAWWHGCGQTPSGAPRGRPRWCAIMTTPPLTNWYDFAVFFTILLSILHWIFREKVLKHDNQTKDVNRHQKLLKYGIIQYLFYYHNYTENIKMWNKSSLAKKAGYVIAKTGHIQTKLPVCPKGIAE